MSAIALPIDRRSKYTLVYRIALLIKKYLVFKNFLDPRVENIQDKLEWLVGIIQEIRPELCYLYNRRIIIEK